MTHPKKGRFRLSLPLLSWNNQENNIRLNSFLLTSCQEGIKTFGELKKYRHGHRS